MTKRRWTDNTMTKRKRTIKQPIKHYTKIWRSSNTNPTKNRG
jgi:hypothetical protein